MPSVHSTLTVPFSIIGLNLKVNYLLGAQISGECFNESFLNFIKSSINIKRMILLEATTCFTVQIALLQLNFKNKYGFPYDLLADEDKSVIEAYGAWGPKKFMGRAYDGIHRTTFIIDQNGVIESVITKVKTKEHTAQILE